MEPWHYWLIAAIILCSLELLTADFLFAGIGVPCGCASLAAASGATFPWQLGIFSFSMIIMLAVVRPIAKKALYRRSDPQQHNTNAMIGQVGQVIDAIGDDEFAVGRVKLGAEEWRAMTDGRCEVPDGALVVVDRVDGATLIVKPK